MEARIVLLPGDGIGPEVVDAARRVLDAVAYRNGHKFDYDTRLVGGVAIDATGSPLPDDTVAACQSADAILMGAVGDPRFDDPDLPVRPEAGLLGLRKALGVFANLRPVRIYRSLAGASPLKPDRLDGVDIMVVRELTGGLYFGQPRGRRVVDGVEYAVDTLEYSETEISRVARLAFELARGRRGRLTSVDKANVLESSRLWRKVTTALAKDYADVELDHQLVDATAMRLVTMPRSFDVIVTENMFGDILTDEASTLAGSLGLLPSASLGEGKRGLYEPVHGSAPDIAGRGIANPIGAIASAAFLLRYSLGLASEAGSIEDAIEAALESGARTPDLGGKHDTAMFTDVVIGHLRG